MNQYLASSLARARHRTLLAESAERRRTAVARPSSTYLRRAVGGTIARLGRAFVSLGEAIAWPA